VIVFGVLMMGVDVGVGGGVIVFGVLMMGVSGYVGEVGYLLFNFKG